MIFYVDGACSGNGTEHATGGFGVVGFVGNVGMYYYSGCSEDTTNNREELKAILHVMEKFAVKEKVFEEVPEEYYPIVYSDSAYSVNTLNDWMFRWADNNWLKSDNRTPENLDLIQKYYNLYQKGYRIDLRKIKGHAGHIGNEMADLMAKYSIANKVSPHELSILEMKMMTGDIDGKYNSDSNYR